MTNILSAIAFTIALFLIFKFTKNEWIETMFIIAISAAIKLIVKDGSFYPLFALPSLIALRHKNFATSVVYLFSILTFVNILQGFGVWTVAQYVLYFLISFIAYLLKSRLLKNKSFPLVYNFTAMFAFGVFMDIFTFFAGNMMGYENVFEQIYMGLPFDLKYGLSGAIYGGIAILTAYLASFKKESGLSNLTLVKQ